MPAAFHPSCAGRLGRRLGATILALLLTPALLASAPDDAIALTRLADDYVAAYRERNPEAAVFAGMASPSERLYDNSAEALAAWQAREDAWWQALQAIDADALRDTPQWVTHGFLHEALASSRAMRVCRSEWWPVSQLEGWQMTMTGLADLQPVDSTERRQRLLAQWRDWPRYLEVEVANLRAGLAAGYSTPRPGVQRVLAQLDGLLATLAAESPLDLPAQRADDPSFSRQWRALVARELLPAMRAYREFLANEYLPRARDELSVLAHPDGEACYAASLRRYTGLPTPADDIMAAGEAAVADSAQQVRALAKQRYGTEDLGELRARMAADPDNHFKTRDEVLAYSEAALARARPVLSAHFHPLPKADVRIEPMPAFAEAGGVAHYVPGAADGSRPGTYAISLHAPEAQNKAGLESTAFHEALPGHHLQVALGQEAGPAHPIAQLVWNSGFGEGWAVYAERLAGSMGLFSSDLSRLGSAIQTPTGMVADPGLHLRRWSRQQTIDYLLAHRADYSPEYAAAQTDRMSVMPGQLTTYFVGALEIQSLRRKAEQALGERFDVREFHARVLESGAITLPMLRDKIERWIEAAR